MKTSKGIKPFKMRCESKEEIKNAINILRSYFRIDTVFLNGETILILTINGIICTRFDIIGYFEYRDEPELTYSEFMKLYGEEEEVFTREDMKDFAWMCILLDADIRTDVDEIFTKYLSERTND